MPLFRTLFFALFAFSLPTHADCFKRVGDKFSLSPTLLEAIAHKESAMYNHAVNSANRNGTEDVCMMGINSSHFKTLRRFGITRERLLAEPCTCIATGAWILKDIFKSYGESWDSLGMYNTGPNPKLIRIRRNYAASVRKIYERLLREKGISESPFR